MYGLLVTELARWRIKMRKLVFILGLVLLLSFVNADIFSTGQVSYCCEKTTSGAWCQNTFEQNCDPEFRKAPASCEATSYCSLGCCYDSQEGTCMENTPQQVCDNNGGVWGESPECDLPQCYLGCCLIGDQAAFVTLTRCKRLSSLYGLETNYRTDITSELQCILSITSEVEGACVFEEDFERVCKRTTKRECSDIQATIQGNASSVKFHEGYLCSDEELATTCGPSEETTCIPGQDEVYFVDSCGNIANVYDANKIKDKEYWSRIYDVSESCGFGESNANSATCGNCDYFFGSTCKNYERGEDKVKPNYGENICRDLSCTYNGKRYEHGETWCGDSEGIDKNIPGSRAFRLVCYNGDVTIEPCADFRAELCYEEDVNGFRSAQCLANKWQDCSSKDTKKQCENEERRDCKWIGDIEGYKGPSCVPKFSPGFDFWDSGGDGVQQCSSVKAQCEVTFEITKTDGRKCVKNCECLDSNWYSTLKQVCLSMGDCGVKVNYLGKAGSGDGWRYQTKD